MRASRGCARARRRRLWTCSSRRWSCLATAPFACLAPCASTGSCTLQYPTLHGNPDRNLIAAPYTLYPIPYTLQPRLSHVPGTVRESRAVLVRACAVACFWIMNSIAACSVAKC